VHGYRYKNKCCHIWYFLHPLKHYQDTKFLSNNDYCHKIHNIFSKNSLFHELWINMPSQAPGIN